VILTLGIFTLEGEKNNNCNNNDNKNTTTTRHRASWGCYAPCMQSVLAVCWPKCTKIWENVEDRSQLKPFCVSV